jgi:hypothetical protein
LQEFGKMDTVAQIRASLGDEWLPSVYEHKVRSQRTRAYHLDIPKRDNSPQIQYTLLGIELKVGRRRFACPDLATARYLRVFARIGCTDFAVPYDISQISGIADELETAWQRALLVAEETNLRSAVVKVMRDEIARIGPGEPMPLFDRETKQRGAA